MGFDVSKFSQAGLSLLASLTAGKILKIKHVYADTIEYLESEIEQSAAWWASNTASTMAKMTAVISGAGHQTDQARLTVKMALNQNQSSSLTVKTIVITACSVEGGIEGSEVVLCGMIDSNGVEVLYNASGIKLSTAVSCYFAFNAASSITIDTIVNPDFALQSELDRFVSVHTLGDASSGDDQTIKGHKTFSDTCYFNQQLTVTQLYANAAFITTGMTLQGGLYMSSNSSLVDIQTNKLTINSTTPTIASTASTATLNMPNGAGTFGRLTVNSAGYTSVPLIETGATDGGYVNLAGYSMNFGDNDDPFEEVHVNVTSCEVDSICTVVGNDMLSIGGLLDLSVGGTVNGEGFFDVQPYNYGKIFCGGDIEIKPSTGDISAKTFNGLLESLFSNGVGGMYKLKVAVGAGVPVIVRGTVMQSDLTNYVINYQDGSSYSAAPSNWKFTSLEYNPGDGVTEFWGIRTV